MADDADVVDTPDDEPEAESALKTITKTQEEFDAIVEQRVARERKKFADYEDLKAAKAELDQIKTDQLGETERERVAREAAESRVAALEERLARQARESAIKDAGTEAGVKNLSLLLKAVDITELTVGDDGQVSGVEAAVKAALAENPELVGAKARRGGADQGARDDGPHAITQAEFDALSVEERAKLIKAGKINHLL